MNRAPKVEPAIGTIAAARTEPDMLPILKQELNDKHPLEIGNDL